MGSVMTAHRRVRRSPWDIPIPWIAGSAIVAFLLAFTGWVLAETALNPFERFEVAFYRALSVNTLSDLYGTPFWSDPEMPRGAQISLFLARWVGVATFSMLLLKAYQGLFSERFARFTAARLKDHIVVIGDTDFARAAIEEASKFGQVVWATEHGVTSDEGNILRLAETGDGETMVRVTAAHRARAVLVSLPDDSRTFNSTRDMLRAEQIFGTGKISQVEPLAGPHFFAVVSDRWDAYPDEAAVLINPTADRADPNEGSGLDSVGEFITEARTAARAALGNAPLFLLAGNGPQHALVVGFGDFGEALLTELCESQRTDLYGRQRITIVDKDKGSWDRFTSRVPDHADVFDAAFFEIDIAATSGGDPAWRQLLEHVSRHPLTAAYVATGKATSSRLSASELRMKLLGACEHSTYHTGRSGDGLSELYDALAFPVFAYSRETSLFTSGGHSRSTLVTQREPEKRMPIIPFGAWSEMVSAARLFDDEPDAHAYEINATHHRLYAPEGSPLPFWRSLSEMSRYSSRSAAAYTPALLHAAGYDLSPWYKEAQSSESAVTLNNLPRLATIPDFDVDTPLLMKLARLEHARWCAERRLKGYRHGPVKDQARRHHPSLVDFDQLDEASQKYNIRYIKSLFATLAQKDTDLVVHRREDAPRAIARPTDISLLKKLGMLPGAAKPKDEGGHGDV